MQQMKWERTNDEEYDIEIKKGKWWRIQKFRVFKFVNKSFYIFSLMSLISLLTYAIIKVH